jgi:peptide/nickel transport system permease protein
MTERLVILDTSETESGFSIGRILPAFWGFMRRWPVIPVIVLIFLVILAVFAPLIAPADPNKQDLRSNLARPFWDDDYYENDRVGSTIKTRHILGADKFGRDVFSRVVFGTRVSLMVAIVSMISGTILGAWAGIMTGFYGGLFDELMTRYVDVWNALPFLLIALVVSITLGQSVLIMMVLLIMLTWVGFVRNIRAEVLSL